ncbi:hypothetical protein M2140_001620 [Clostridiales Family XIII bacterium PM5-7]
MSFGWINLINTLAVICLILINIIAMKKNIAGDFSSKNRIINVLEQLGRYGCMAMMVIPLTFANWEFGFSSVAEMLIWIFLTIVLLIVYAVLWIRKSKGGSAIFYGLAIVPVCLFLMNGILLRHIMLVIFALIFGVCHLMIVRENIEK